MSPQPINHKLLALATQYYLNHNYEAALALYQQAALADPSDLSTSLNMANALIHLGRPYQAITTLNHIFPKHPQPHLIHLLLSQLYSQLKEYQQALVHNKALAKLRPGVNSLHALANTHHQLGHSKRAISLYHQTLMLNPQHLATLNNLGVLYTSQGKTKLATKHLHQALNLDPNFSDAHSNLGHLYELQGDLNKSINHYQHATSLDPKHFVAWSNLSAVYFKQDRLDLAKNTVTKALTINPRHAISHFRLGIYLQGLDKLPQAINSFNACYQVDTNFAYTLSYAYYTSLQICDWSQLSTYQSHLDNLINHANKNKLYYDPYIDLYMHHYPKLNSIPATNHSNLVDSRMGGPHIYTAPAKSKIKHKTINIGYLSKDFNNHPTGHLIPPLFQHHDRSRFTIHTFSYGANDHSSYFNQIKNHSNTFTDLTHLTHHQASAAIKDNHVDILVDIAVHTANDRPEILALRPAPVQISYLAFPGSTGASFFDYLVADHTLIPKSHRPYYREKIIYLPHTYQITNPDHPVSSTTLSRSQFGLPDKASVFACFNHFTKIDPQAFQAWINILKSVTGSVLWFINHNHFAPKKLRQQAKQLGVDPHRLIFSDSAPKADHLARHRLADLALDTFIYNGHTTTSDALMMDIPVVTLKGPHFASRVAASLLIAIGVPELITHSPKEYEHLAINLATHPKKLKALKSKILNHKSSHPLFDPPRFVNNLESAYITAHRRYTNKRPPRTFSIRDSTPLQQS